MNYEKISSLFLDQSSIYFVHFIFFDQVHEFSTFFNLKFRFFLSILNKNIKIQMPRFQLHMNSQTSYFAACFSLKDPP